jgi:hypothetical protein
MLRKSREQQQAAGQYGAMNATPSGRCVVGLLRRNEPSRAGDQFGIGRVY